MTVHPNIVTFLCVTTCSDGSCPARGSLALSQLEVRKDWRRV